MSIENTQHKVMDKQERGKLANTIMDEIDKARPGKSIQPPSDLEGIKSKLSVHTNSNLIKIKEFFNKVAVLFKENIITKRVNSVETENSRTR
jgi:hypothetical protein